MIKGYARIHRLRLRQSDFSPPCSLLRNVSLLQIYMVAGWPGAEIQEGFPLAGSGVNSPTLRSAPCPLPTGHGSEVLDKSKVNGRQALPC